MIEEGSVDTVLDDWSGVIYFGSVFLVNVEHLVFVRF
jgi:hypothetical protein